VRGDAADLKLLRQRRPGAFVGDVDGNLANHRSIWEAKPSRLFVCWPFVDRVGGHRLGDGGRIVLVMTIGISFLKSRPMTLSMLATKLVVALVPLAVTIRLWK